MPQGLKVRRGSNVVFDSTRAAGGVCLGIFTIPGSGRVLTFPYLPVGSRPSVVYSDGTSRALWTYDEALGYPRFTFAAMQGLPASNTVGVFLT